MKLKQFALTTLVVFLASNIFGQKLSTLRDDSLFLAEQLELTKKQHKLFLDTTKFEFKKDYKNYLKERNQEIENLYKNKELIAAPAEKAFLQRVLDRLVKANPELQQFSIRAFLFRSPVANAATFGEGTVVFHTGLLVKLKNEAQFAAVLGHELAHQCQDHVHTSLRQYITKLNDKDLQKDLKRLSKQEYGAGKEIEALEKQFAFNLRKHSRAHELEADSLGAIFMSRAGYDAKEVIAALQILDSLDADHPDTEKMLRKQFDFANYPFKDRWLRREEGLLSGHGKLVEDTLLADSLKTHPDCKLRIQKIKPLIGRLTKNAKPVLAGTAYDSLSRKMEPELLANLFDAERYGQSLYKALCKLEHNPADSLSLVIIAHSLNKMHALQKDHHLYTTIGHPSPQNNNAYNVFLAFIENLRLHELASLAEQFALKHVDQLRQNEDFVAACITACDINENATEKNKWKKHYQQTFPKPKYKF
jgi:Zn-dependent protease with chaperone function